MHGPTCVFWANLTPFSLKSIRIRSAIIGCLYRKSIGLSPGAKAAYSSGKITNLMSNDADKLIMCCFQVPWLWQVPINFCVAAALVVNLLGLAGIVGISLMVVLLPLTTLVIRRLRGLRQGVMQFSDARVKYILEVIQGIRIVKFMSWEQKFEDKIGDIRAQELRFFQKTALVQAAQFTLANTTPIAISLVTLWAYTVLFGNELTASTAFTALQLLRVLQVPLQQFPNIMSSTVIDGGTALGRMSKFMQEPESDESDSCSSSDKDKRYKIFTGYFMVFYGIRANIF